MTEALARPLNRREKQRAQTRERVFEAAMEEFIEVGFNHAQIPRIALAAGVSRGTFYFHFPSKEHVLLELSQRAQAGLAENVGELRSAGASLREVLRSLVVDAEQLLDVTGDTNLVRDMLSMHVRAPIQEPVADEPMPVLAELTLVFENAITKGEVRGDVEAEQLAVTVMTSLFAGLLAATQSDEASRSKPLQLLMDLLLDGMGPSASTAPPIG